MNVTYKPCVGFPQYVVGDNGTVFNVKGGRMRELKPVADKDGYMKVSLVAGGKKHNRAVHRLVLEAFVGQRPPGMQACHFPDRDPSNNRLDNLRWDTPKGNQADRVAQGTKLLGESHQNAVLDVEKVQLVRGMFAKGTKKAVIAREFGVSHKLVRNIINRKAWAHV